MDTEAIRLGEDYKQRISSEIESCDVFLAVTGRQWLEILSERKDTEDFVRLEIDRAFSENKLIIPITVENTQPPKAELLPDKNRIADPA